VTGDGQQQATLSMESDKIARFGGFCPAICQARVNSDLARRLARWHDSSDVRLKNLPDPQLMRH
jgi:hypothetical protein